jgi:hypothetical protein
MPKTPWTSIILDFIIKLLLLRDLITGVEYDFILVIMDRLTKYTYIILYLKANTAEDLAYTCYEHARDQGTLGLVASCRHGRTPGRTYGFLIYKKRP